MNAIIMNAFYNSFDAAKRALAPFSFLKAAAFAFFFVASILASSTASSLYALTDDAEAQAADATDAKTDSQWFRLVYENGAPVEMQTSIVSFSGSYVGSDGTARDVVVDLVGAIHMADKSYYERLNKEFSTYETVIFELVANRGADIKKVVAEERDDPDKNKFDLNPLNIVSTSQQLGSLVLDMTYQIDGIDYLAPNLRRGDMDAEDFIIQIFQNGDVGRFFTDAFFSSFVDDSLGSLEGAGVALICAKDRRLALKRLMATELVEGAIDDIAKQTEALQEEESENDAEPESVLIQLRNKKALEVVKQELDAGRTRVAVFYGAAHLPDLAQRLQKDFGLKQNPEPRWMSAWEMRSGK